MGRGGGHGARRGRREAGRPSTAGGRHRHDQHYGPYHQIWFEALSGFECHGEEGHHEGGECDVNYGRIFLRFAQEHGYRGPPDPHALRQFLRPIYRDLERHICAAIAYELAIPGFNPTSAAEINAMLPEIQAHRDRQARGRRRRGGRPRTGGFGMGGMY